MEHPEYRLTLWHLLRQGLPEQLWFYCVEDLAECLFDRLRDLGTMERVTFCVEWWSEDGVCLLQAHGAPQRLLAFYGWPENITLHLTHGRQHHRGEVAS